MWQWQIWIPKQQKTTKKQILIPVCGWIQFVCLCPPTCILKDRSSPNQFTERFSLQVQGCVITIFCGLLPGVGVIEAVGEGVVWSVGGNVGGFARWWYLKGIWLGYGVGFSVLWVSHVRRRLFKFNQTAEEMIPCHAIWGLHGIMFLCENRDIEVLTGPAVNWSCLNGAGTNPLLHVK